MSGPYEFLDELHMDNLDRSSLRSSSIEEHDSNIDFFHLIIRQQYFLKLEEVMQAWGVVSSHEEIQTHLSWTIFPEERAP